MAIDAIRISILKLGLDKVLGQGNWGELEAETIFLALDLPYSDLMMDKVYLLKVLVTKPDLFYSDIGLTLYATEVINNNVADFSFVPHITSLELAFALSEVKAILTSEKSIVGPSEGFGKAVAYILREEGYSKPIPPFEFVPESLLVPGQLESDTADKAKAIQHYIQGKHNDDNN